MGFGVAMRVSYPAADVGVAWFLRRFDDVFHLGRKAATSAPAPLVASGGAPVRNISL